MGSEKEKPTDDAEKPTEVGANTLPDFSRTQFSNTVWIRGAANADPKHASGSMEDDQSFGEPFATSEMLADDGITRTKLALYDLDDVRAALGLSAKSDSLDWPTRETSGDSEHQSRLNSILYKGDEGRWRYTLGPSIDAEAKIASVVACAPYFAELAVLLQTNVKAARTIGLPMFITPIVLEGSPGVGKSWLLSRLAKLLGLPFRTYAMSTSTLGEGLQGSHPSWRNAEPGMVAKTLLREKVANPIFLIDEFDKVSVGAWNNDPYRPFYQLLDPSGSASFVDEYLGFAIDASKILWVMAANDLSMVPGPILDRLTVLQVPEPTITQRFAVIKSIYAEVNAEHRVFFERELDQVVVEKLTALHPRAIRLVLQAAMAYAAADDRRALRPDDIKLREVKIKPRAGFLTL